MDEKRQERKNQHLQYALELPAGPLSSGWEDVKLIHQALLQGNMAAIDTSTVILEKRLKLPIIINAMTGGAPGLEKINAALARVAAECGLGMAVGSQTAAVTDKTLRYTYEVVRKVNPEGLVLANVSALAEPRAALEAVEMIQADALQLHLNGLQELLMREGDRDFVNLAANIANIMDQSPVPVIVKEVGCGLSKETAHGLYNIGVRSLDVSGAGGTNFAAIELARSGATERDYLRTWGLSTVVSLLEVNSLELPFTTVLASGGIRNALDICKALSLGADSVAMAGSILKVLLEDGEEALARRIEELGEELQILMLLMGRSRITELREQPLVITGSTKEWCEQRGINTAAYARRGRNRGGDANDG